MHKKVGAPNIPSKYSRLFTRDAFIKMFKFEV